MNMVDVCDRFHASGTVENREMATLLEAIDVIWITVLGAFKTLVIDGETSLNTKHAEDRLNAKGISLKPRAPHQHARIVERRQAILRQAMHTADEQLKNEGVPATVRQILAWCTYAGNALITYDGATPFNARFGRQPSMLPDMHMIPDDQQSRDLQRVREVAIQKIIEATAYERIKRAQRTTTTPAGQQLDYKPGDQVDFWRPSGSKDKSGWQQGAVVVENLPSEGQVKVRYKGNRDILVKYPDARRHMEFLALDLTPDNAKTSALKVIQDHLNRMRPRSFVTFGYMEDGQVTVASKKWPKVVFALDFIMRNIFGFPRVLAVKLGTSISKIPASKGSSYSLICWWRDHFKNHETLELNPDVSTSTSDIVGPEWPLFNYMQILTSSDADHGITDIPGEIADDNGPDMRPSDEASAAESAGSRLSTIQEGSNEDGSDFLVRTPAPKQNMPDYLFGYVDEDLWQELDVGNVVISVG